MIFVDDAWKISSPNPIHRVLEGEVQSPRQAQRQSHEGSGEDSRRVPATPWIVEPTACFQSGATYFPWVPGSG